MADPTPEETEETPKKKKKKILLIIPVLLLVAGGGGGAFVMTSKKAKVCPTDETHVASASLNGFPITLAASGSAAGSQTPTTAAPAAAAAATDEHAAEGDEASKEADADAEFLAKCAEEAEAKLHGPIVRLTPITMNLSDGHILKVGLALQLVTEPEDVHLAAVVAAASAGGHGAAPAEISATPLGGAEAKALNTAINYLGNSTYDALSAPDGRAKAGDELSAQIKEIYHGDIVKVYFTDFVMS